MSRIVPIIVLTAVLLFVLPTPTHERAGAGACGKSFAIGDASSGPCMRLSPTMRLRVHPLALTALAGQAIGEGSAWTSKALLAGKAMASLALAALAMSLLGKKGAPSRRASQAPVDDRKERKQREQEREKGRER